MRRRANGDEFRSNFHLGGSVEKVEIDQNYEKIAIKAARILGLEIAGVDLLESERGALVLEVNSSPGLEGIEKASQINVARAVSKRLNYLLQKNEARLAITIFFILPTHFTLGQFSSFFP